MYLIFIECLLNDRMQEDFFILLIKNMNMSSFWEENVSLSHPCLWDRARCPCGLRRPGRAMSQRCTPLPPPHRPTWVVWVNELSSEAWAVLFSISASLFPFTAEAALSSVGHGTRSRSWKGLLQPSTPVWTRGKTRASLPSHLQAYLRVLELLFIYIFIYMELLRLSTISRWPWRKSWTLSA